jgi:hypothetical protein
MTAAPPDAANSYVTPAIRAQLAGSYYSETREKERMTKDGDMDSDKRITLCHICENHLKNHRRV